MTALEILSDLGFRSIDWFFLLVCFSAGVIGGVADYLLKRADIIRFDNSQTDLVFRQYAPLMVARLFVAGFSGVVVWLLLVGVVDYSKSGFIRYVLFALAGGFSGPTLARDNRGVIARSIRKLTDQPS